MKSCAIYKQGPKAQQGIAIVELAIALPIILVMLLASAELTRVLYQYNTLTKLVRDGSRFAAVHTFAGDAMFLATNQEITQIKRLTVSGQPQGGTALLRGMSVDDVSVSVNEVGTLGSRRHYVEVTANYNYAPIFATNGGDGPLLQALNFDFNLSASSSMRVQ